MQCKFKAYKIKTQTKISRENKHNVKKLKCELNLKQNMREKKNPKKREECVKMRKWPCHEKNSTWKNNAMRIEFENQRVEMLENLKSWKIENAKECLKRA